MRAERPSKLTQRPLYALLAFPPGLAWLNCITRGKHIIYFQRPFKFQWSFSEEIFFFRYLLSRLDRPQSQLDSYLRNLRNLTAKLDWLAQTPSASFYFHNMFCFKCQSYSYLNSKTFCGLFTAI